MTKKLKKLLTLGLALCSIGAMGSGAQAAEQGGARFAAYAAITNTMGGMNILGNKKDGLHYYAPDEIAAKALDGNGAVMPAGLDFSAGGYPTATNFIGVSSPAGKYMTQDPSVFLPGVQHGISLGFMVGAEVSCEGDALGGYGVALEGYFLGRHEYAYMPVYYNVRMSNPPGMPSAVNNTGLEEPGNQFGTDRNSFRLHHRGTGMLLAKKSFALGSGGGNKISVGFGPRYSRYTLHYGAQQFLTNGVTSNIIPADENFTFGKKVKHMNLWGGVVSIDLEMNLSDNISAFIGGRFSIIPSKHEELKFDGSFAKQEVAVSLANAPVTTAVNPMAETNRHTYSVTDPLTEIRPRIFLKDTKLVLGLKVFGNADY